MRIIKPQIKETFKWNIVCGGIYKKKDYRQIKNS